MQFVKELAEEEDQADFFDDEMEEQSVRSVLYKKHSTSKRQDNTMTAYPYLQGILDIDMAINNQIIAAKMAECALKDLEGEAEVKLEDLHAALDEASKI